MQGEYRGDFTRDTFDPTKHFSRVLMQQGRVQVDADWNEQTSILLHYLRTLAIDLIGPHWGPRQIAGVDNTGFLIEKGDDPNDFSIGFGRYYVDGILCESDTPIAYSEQVEFPLDVQDDEVETGASLVYLDVWERHITAADDGLIRESALGGPDTATRAKVVWQVKVIPPEEFNDKWVNFPASMSAAERRSEIEKFLRSRIGSSPRTTTTGVMRAMAKKRERASEPCSISPESRYRGMENHLYRVEIHKSGVAWDGKTKNGRPSGNIDEAATFKWSSDNSSIGFSIISLNDGKATLAGLGRDSSSTLRINDWVEIVDDTSIFRGAPGLLRQVESIDTLEMSVKLRNPEGLPEYDEEEDGPRHPMLRRWDFRSDEDGDRALPVTEAADEDSGWIALEDGIQIQFQAADGPAARTYRSGDYWLIPARTATGDVEWKTAKDPSGKESPAALAPHGVDHHYAPLAVIVTEGDGTVDVPLDCRRLIP